MLEEINYYSVYYLTIIASGVDVGFFDFTFEDFYKVGSQL